MPRLLLDTNIILEYLHGEGGVVPLFDAFGEGTIKIDISVITEFELLAYPKLTAHEEASIGLLLKEMNIQPVDHRVATTAALLSRQYRGTPNDLFIASTALLYNIPLVTHNVRDFKKIKNLNILTEWP